MSVTHFPSRVMNNVFVGRDACLREEGKHSQYLKTQYGLQYIELKLYSTFFK